MAQEIHIPITHFELSDDIKQSIRKFAVSHISLDRHQFKDAWNKWLHTEEVKNTVIEEYVRLTDLGYDGDMYEKMFCSARYYHRKREIKRANMSGTGEDDQPKQRKKYTANPKELLAAISDHIMSQMEQNMVYSDDGQKTIIQLTPANAYSQFCIDYPEYIGTTPEEIAKTKKTYKNKMATIIAKFRQ